MSTKVRITRPPQSSQAAGRDDRPIRAGEAGPQPPQPAGTPAPRVLLKPAFLASLSRENISRGLLNWVF